MRNLKRTLSLAALMLMGMMVVSAGAASKDFTDKDEIKHSEAVNTMVSLNVISGKEDGSYFDPTGTLTRAEMAKVISYVMNGGVEPVLGVKVTPTYSDIKGHWAEAYIEYCTSMGIITGDGAGKFNPEGTLTAEQAAKMFLTAMGYNANVFGFTGNNWSVNTNRYANEAGLYKELGSLQPSNPISRDDACQMAYNAVQATMMKRSWSQDLQTGELTETYVPWTDSYTDSNGVAVTTSHTLLVDKFNANIYEGVLAATGEYDLSAIIGNNGRKANKDGFVVNVERVNGGTVTKNDTYFEYKEQDLTNLMGQYVKVLRNEKTEEVYGIYPVAGKNSVLETAASLTDYTGLTNKVKVDGTTYNMESDIIYIKGEAAGSKSDTNNLMRADKVVFVDNDGNGKFDVALVTPVDVAKVTFMNETNITFTPVVNNATLNGNAQLLEDVIISDGLAKDDYAVLTPSYYNDADTLTKVDVASGTVSGVRNPVTTTAPYDDYQIENQWYKVAISSGTIANSAITSGSVVDYVAVNGVLFYAKLTSGASLKDVAVISELADEVDAFGNHTLKAKVIFSDGSVKEVAVDGLYANYITTTNSNNKNGVVDNGAGSEASYVGVLTSYKVTNSGSYNFYKLSNTANNKAGFDTVINTAGGVPVEVYQNQLTINKNLVANDAVIVVRNKAAATTTSGSPAKPDANSLDGKITYVSGGDFKNMNIARFDATDGAYALIGKDADGFSRVKFAIVEATTTSVAGDESKGYNTADKKFTLGTVSGSEFGYLTKNSWTETINGEDYNCFQVWNGSEEVVLKAKDSTTFYAARSIISYDLVGEGIIKNVTINGSMNEGAITAFSANSVEMDANTTYKITSDTVVLNVNDTTKTGHPGNSLLVATEIGNSGLFVKNARYVVSNSEVKVIAVDVNNEIVPTTGAQISIGSTNAASLNAALDAVSTVEVTGALTLDGDVTVPAGKTLILKNGVNTAGKAFTVNGTLNLTGAVTGGTIKVGASGKVNLVGATGCTAANVNAMIPEVGAKLTVDTAIASGLTGVYLNAGSLTSAGVSVAGATTSNIAANTKLEGTTVYTDTSAHTAVHWQVKP